MKFKSLCTYWHEKFQDILKEEGDPTYTQLYELGDYRKCVIGVCHKTIHTSFYYGGRGKQSCTTCFKLSRHPIIHDIQYNHDTKKNIRRFYKEIVPEIEQHYQEAHISK